MKLLTKNTDYAIRALLHLAKQGDRFTSSRKISGDETIPLPYLRRILQRLRKEKLITAREGVNGGVKNIKLPAEIRITDLIRIFQGEVSLLDCVFRKNPCINVKTCPLRRRIQKIENEVLKELEEITIADLLDDLKKGAS